jgi:hypothetical protein
MDASFGSISRLKLTLDKELHWLCTRELRRYAESENAAPILAGRGAEHLSKNP